MFYWIVAMCAMLNGWTTRVREGAAVLWWVWSCSMRKLKKRPLKVKRILSHGKKAKKHTKGVPHIQERSFWTVTMSWPRPNLWGAVSDESSWSCGNMCWWYRPMIGGDLWVFGCEHCSVRAAELYSFRGKVSIGLDHNIDKLTMVGSSLKWSRVRRF